MRACTRVKKKNMHISAYTEKMNQIFTTRESCAEQPDGRRPGAKAGFLFIRPTPDEQHFALTRQLCSLSLSLNGSAYSRRAFSYFVRNFQKEIKTIVRTKCTAAKETKKKKNLLRKIIFPELNATNAFRKKKRCINFFFFFFVT